MEERGVLIGAGASDEERIGDNSEIALDSDDVMEVVADTPPQKRSCCAGACPDRSQRVDRSCLICLGVSAVVMIIILAVLGTRSGGSSSSSNGGAASMEAMELFASSLRGDRIRSTLYEYTREAHIAGTQRDYETAVYTRDEMLAAGIPRVDMEEYSVLLSYPLKTFVRLLGPGTPYTTSSREPPKPEDPTSNKTSPPPFLGYSASGNVTGELVYVNYGREEDWEALLGMGISAVGRIAIMRYGRIFRGNKCALAEANGAVGCLLYSDPADDGFLRGETYTNGPWRPKEGVQRGSIFLEDGDPLTPGVPAVPGAPRLAAENASLPGIPALPLSWGDAEPLLKQLSGVAPPQGWTGGIPGVTYSPGPGPALVHMDIVMNNTRTTIWNVIGRIDGDLEPDRLVILGNHRDAWTFGGGDPNSGSATLLEVARGLAVAYNDGWRPSRSIWLCSWDAEEEGLIGSVEFSEQYEKMLMQQTVVYLNVDIAITGTDMLALDGMPSLSDVMGEVTAATRLRTTGVSLLTLWRNYSDENSASSHSSGTHSGGDPSTDAAPTLSGAALGAGSDYGPFVQHLGIPAVNYEMSSSSGSYEGVYHSNYDSFYWQTKFGDPTPDFTYYTAMAEVWGRSAMVLADRPVVPFRFARYVTVLDTAVNAVEDAISAARTSYSVDPSLTVEPLRVAMNLVRVAAADLDALISNAEARQQTQPSPLAVMRLRQLNDVLILAERSFLFFRGIPGRNWNRNLVWATGEYNSYGSSVFSAVLDQLTIRNWTAAQYELGLVSVVLRQFAAALTPPAAVRSFYT